MRILRSGVEGAQPKKLDRVLPCPESFIDAFRVRGPPLQQLAEEALADVTAQMAKGVPLAGHTGTFGKSQTSRFACET